MDVKLTELNVAIFQKAITTHMFPYFRNYLVPGIRKFDNVIITKKEYVPCDVAVYISGPRYSNISTKAKQATYYRTSLINNFPKTRLVWESTIFRRNRTDDRRRMYYRLGINGFQQNDADFRNKNSPPDRWLRIQKEQNIKLYDWKSRGDNIVVCMQRENDCTLRGLDIKQWTIDVCHELRQYTDRPIVIRPHPSSPTNIPTHEIDTLNSITVTDAESAIAKHFDSAWAVVTFSSLSAIEAICDGIPTFALDKGSMAWGKAGCNLSDIEAPKIFEREQWLYDLAYAQWTLDEMKEGIPWQRLRTYFIKEKKNETNTR